MTTYDLNSITSKDLENILGNDPFALLVGSGISIWKPTELPAGQDFTSAVLDILFNLTGLSNQAEEGNLDKFLAMVPFEVLMERCPNQQKLREIIFKLFGGPREPNGI